MVARGSGTNGARKWDTIGPRTFHVSVVPSLGISGGERRGVSRQSASVFSL